MTSVDSVTGTHDDDVEDDFGGGGGGGTIGLDDVLDVELVEGGVDE